MKFFKKAEPKDLTLPRTTRKAGIIAFRTVLLVIGLVVFIVGGVCLGYVTAVIREVPDIATLSLKPTSNYTSFVYDAEGNQINTFATADSRIYAELDQIPEYLQHAFIALEDKRFYEHNGIDIYGIARALVHNVKSGSFSQGASTLTQQLVKNNILTSEKKIARKIQEQYLAVEFEKIYDKKTILEYYLNTIALGEGVSGVQAASLRYFGKNVEELSLTESCVLAVITQRPTYYNPIRNPENNWDKVKICLAFMEEQGYITTQEHEDALLENPYEDIQTVNQAHHSKSVHSYFIDALLDQLYDDFQNRLGYTEQEAQKAIYGGGLQIYTTQDSKMQEIADNVLNDESLYPTVLYELYLDYTISYKDANGELASRTATGIVRSKDEVDTWKKQQLTNWGIHPDKVQQENLIQQPQPQAAFVLTDYRTGQVKALAGGRGDKTNRGFNYATQATRQPGSTFKVLAAYAPALDLGKLSEASTLVDEPYTVTPKGGKPYTPSNWDNKYIGATNMRKAIYHSMNVVAVKTVSEIVGVETAFDYLKKFGFTTLTEADKVHALPLGGITNGVTVLELNAAYSAIANGGVYIKPIFYTEVKDAEGNVLLSNTGEELANQSHRVINEYSARLLTDMMQDVITIGTGTTVKSCFTEQPVAGKTGTTSDSKDLVFAGYTPYYSATIWTGYSQQKSLAKGGGSYHLKIWGEIMRQVHTGYERKEFTKPVEEHETQSTQTVEEYYICPLSGQLATSACYHSEGNEPTLKYLTKDEAPVTYCNVHEEIVRDVAVSTASDKLSTEFCPEDTVTHSTAETSQTGNIEDSLAESPTEEISPTTDEEGIITFFGEEIVGFETDFELPPPVLEDPFEVKQE